MVGIGMRAQGGRMAARRPARRPATITCAQGLPARGRGHQVEAGGWRAAAAPTPPAPDRARARRQPSWHAHRPPGASLHATSPRATATTLPPGAAALAPPWPRGTSPTAAARRPATPPSLQPGRCATRRASRPRIGACAKASRCAPPPTPACGVQATQARGCAISARPRQPPAHALVGLAPAQPGSSPGCLRLRTRGSLPPPPPPPPPGGRLQVEQRVVDVDCMAALQDAVAQAGSKLVVVEVGGWRACARAGWPAGCSRGQPPHGPWAGAAPTPHPPARPPARPLTPPLHQPASVPACLPARAQSRAGQRPGLRALPAACCRWGRSWCVRRVSMRTPRCTGSWTRRSRWSPA
jgi:hypothetical protein